ncbi:hypothetical protein LMG33810_002856 [Carnimonas sp. LMG 33810]
MIPAFDDAISAIYEAEHLASELMRPHAVTFDGQSYRVLTAHMASYFGAVALEIVHPIEVWP